MNAPAPNVGAELGAKLSSMNQGGGSATTSRIFGHGWDELPGIMDAMLKGTENMLGSSLGSFGNHGLLKGLGQGGIDGGLADIIFRGIDASKETAFKTPEIGAGSAAEAVSHNAPKEEAPVESKAEKIAGGTNTPGSNTPKDSGGSSSESSGSTGSGGSNHAFPTTKQAVGQSAQDMKFAGEVAMGRMGLLAPNNTPGMAKDRGIGVGTGAPAA